ncbi:FUSC family protein [Myxococcus sp. K15C18031901]|uniref:FUSC family protein n=1 Tax=Myxococcus dinghuensis TaxID=2906761 RepID=UPI0020A7ABAF|nr:FUSC family protein [Myxococcus dinghuensis]MCP3102090.1 FUSC family protein [Myxococcus dinghuensis]
MNEKLLFSFKTFVAAALAVTVAFYLGLDRPSWAFATVYLVSQPLTGASRLKGLLRSGGTFLGGVASLLLAAVFIDSPFAMTVAIIAWASLWLGVSMLDRRPTNYLFVMIGITPMIGALPGAVDPTQVFSTVVARVTELTLAFLSLVVVDSILFPRSARPALGALIRDWLGGAQQWMLDALSDDPARRAASIKDRRALAAKAAALNAFAVNIRFDLDEELRRGGKLVDLLREETLRLLPVMATIEDRTLELTRDGGKLPPALTGFRERLSAWIEAGAPTDGAADLKRTLRGATPAPDQQGWRDLMLAELLKQLRELVTLWSDCRFMQRRLASEEAAVPRRLRLAADRTRPSEHKDLGMVLWTVATGWLVFAAVAGLWYLLDWPHGVGGLLLAIMMALMFSGTSENPLPALKMLTKVLVPAGVLGGFYMFAVFPHIDSMPTLLFALSFLLIPLGVLAANPALGMLAAFPVFQITIDNGPSTGASADFANFVNGQLASLVGVIIAVVVVSIVRVARPDVGVHRILRAGWKDVAELAETPDAAHRRPFLGRMFDRLGLLVPRQLPMDPANALLAADALTDLRVGLHVLDLENHQRQLTPTASQAVDRVLSGVSLHFRSLEEDLKPPPALLLEDIDAALDAATSHGRRCAVALAGLRRALFPDAPSYIRVPSPLLLTAGPTS